MSIGEVARSTSPRDLFDSRFVKPASGIRRLPAAEDVIEILCGVEDSQHVHVSVLLDAVEDDVAMERTREGPATDPAQALMLVRVARLGVGHEHQVLERGL